MYRESPTTIFSQQPRQGCTGEAASGLRVSGLAQYAKTQPYTCCRSWVLVTWKQMLPAFPPTQQTFELSSSDRHLSLAQRVFRIKVVCRDDRKPQS